MKFPENHSTWQVIQEAVAEISPPGGKMVFLESLFVFLKARSLSIVELIANSGLDDRMRILVSH